MNTHEQINELLAGFALGELSQQQSSGVEAHLAECQQCREELKELKAVLDCAADMGELSTDEQTCESAKQSLFAAVADGVMKEPIPRPTIGPESVWRTIMKSPITKLAAAAVIIIAVLIGLTIIPDTSGVAWAEVVNNIEKVKAFTYRMKMSMKGMPGVPDGKTMKLEIEAWISKDVGMRMDSYMEGELVTKAYVLMSERAVVSVIPQAKQYVRMTLTDELFDKMQEDNGDPRKMVDEFMECEYTELGRDTIDGNEVEGIESKDPKIAGGMLGDVVARLWVAVENDLPVRMEIACYSKGTKVLDMVMDEFKWDVEIDAAEFEPNIPDDYKLMADVQMAGDEKNVVEGLSFFAELTGGKYPSEMSVMTITQDLQDAMKAGVADRPEAITGEEAVQKMVDLQMLFTFYAGLVTGDKDPAYYGHKVTAEFPEAVLMRWKVEDSNYRVIFGDLTVGDVTPDELAELEAAPLNTKPIAIKPQPADGAAAAALAEVELSWMPGAYVTEHKVYFGTEMDQLSLLAEVTDSCSVTAPALERRTTYYWRVDEVQPDGSIATGDVWSFNTGKLVGWWKLDEGSGNTAADSSDKGLDGTLVGDISWVDGILAGALAFDGDGDYVDVGKDPAFDITQQITVSAWIKVNAFDREWQAIVTKGDSAWRLQRNWKNNTLEFACTSLVVPGNRWGSIHCTVDVNDGRWHHVAGTYNGSQICLYVDGRLDVSSTASGTIKINNQPVYIGENSERPDRFWNGLIDDVRIYSYALSADEVAELESAPLNTKPIAIKPQPADGAAVAPLAEVELSWMPGAYVTEHKVYFGTAADQLSLLVGLTDSCSVTAPALERRTTYYWRVDEIQPDGTIATGDVWNFDTGKLVGWWKLDGDANDSSGSGNDGTVKGNPNWVIGPIGGALQFDGLDDYIQTGYAADLPVWTVAIWVNGPVVPSSAAPAGPVHRESNLQINWNHSFADFRGAAGLQVENKWYAASFGELQANTWYHLAATYDGENLKAYKNGVLITDNPDPSGAPNKEWATLKFARHANYGDHFEGTIDDVRIYSYDLSADEVAAIYAAQVNEE